MCLSIRVSTSVPLFMNALDLDERIGGPGLRIHDVHMAFKDAGFKGTPRDDVFRRFSPRFGITARKVSLSGDGYNKDFLLV